MRGEQGRRPSRRRGCRADSRRPALGEEHVRCDGGPSRIRWCTHRGGEYTFVTAYVRKRQRKPGRLRPAVVAASPGERRPGLARDRRCDPVF